jgi:cytoskeletal protein CcmA (bactofilin family)
MAEVRIKDIDEHEIDTILAEDIDFEGHLTFKKPLMIKGKFKGEIKSTSSLYIGEKALVEAATEAGIVSSKGRHKGDIVGHVRVELFSTAHVDGDITTPDFIVESGCKFNGHCNMGGVPKQDQKPQAQQAHQPAPQPQQPPAQPQSQQQAQQQPQKPAAAPAQAAPQNAAPQGGQQQAHPQGQQNHGQMQGQQKPPSAPAGQGGQQK